MKILLILPFLAVSCQALAAAQQQNAGASQPPQCAANCTIEAATKKGCGINDMSCLCSKEFIDTVTPCIQGTCSVREALTATKISSDMCGFPNPNGGKILKIIPPTCGGIATLSLVLRFAGKFLTHASIKIEDVLAVASWILLIPGFSIAIEMAQHGMGRNIWEIPQDEIYYIFKLYYIDELVYITSLCLAKLAILFFYLTLFPMRAFRIAVYIFIVLTVLYNLAFVFALAFQCVPASGAWTAWDGTFTGTCIDLKVMWWVAAAVNIAFDFGIMGLPFFPLSKLQMNVRKKIQVGVMFGVGFFVTIVSIIRLQSLIQFGSTSNPTYDDVPLGWWSTLEMCFAIVVSCLPSIRLFILYFFPKFDKDDTSNDKSIPTVPSSHGNPRGLAYASTKKGPPVPGIKLAPDSVSTYELLEVDDRQPSRGTSRVTSRGT